MLGRPRDRMRHPCRLTPFIRPLQFTRSRAVTLPVQTRWEHRAASQPLCILVTNSNMTTPLAIRPSSRYPHTLPEKRPRFATQCASTRTSGPRIACGVPAALCHIEAISRHLDIAMPLAASHTLQLRRALRRKHLTCMVQSSAPLIALLGSMTAV